MSAHGCTCFGLSWSFLLLDNVCCLVFGQLNDPNNPKSDGSPASLSVDVQRLQVRVNGLTAMPVYVHLSACALC